MKHHLALSKPVTFIGLCPPSRLRHDTAHRLPEAIPRAVQEIRRVQHGPQALHHRGVIRDLVNIRASQINGCAFCVDMHVKEATIHGERPLRLHHVAIWRESTLFIPRERAALAWTRFLTQLPAQGAPDDVYEHVRAQLSEEELSDLTFQVMAINAWNRVSVGFQTVPGTADKAYGLDKSGLY